MRQLAALSAIVVPFMLFGCGIRTAQLSGGDVIVTRADERAILQLKTASSSVSGRVKPEYLHCSEPSPDIATAVSKAFGAGGSASVSGLPSGIEPRLALALTRSNAQAMAQLTERLATIQLLRDGLHRACEAYANGAISDTTYAVMLSRFDKLMVTLLLGELTAGAFGRNLAGLGTEAQTSSSASLDHSDKQTRSATIEEQLKIADARDRELQEKTDSAGAAAPETLRQDREQSRKRVDNLQRELIDALKAQAESAAKASNITTGGGIVPSHSPDIAHELAEMQRHYLENLNFDAVEIACVSALDRVPAAPEVLKSLTDYVKAAQSAASEPSRSQAIEHAAADVFATARANGFTALGSYCFTNVLPAIQTKKGELWTKVLERANAQAQRADTFRTLLSTASEVERYNEAIRKLLESFKAVAEPKPIPTATPPASGPRGN